MSRLARLQRHPQTTAVAGGITAFLAEHQLSPGSQRVYAGALHALQDHLGADTSLAVLDEASTAKQFTVWFHRATARWRPPRGSVSSPS